MKLHSQLLLAAGVALVLTGCQTKSSQGLAGLNRNNLVTLGNPENKLTIGEAGKTFSVKTLAQVQSMEKSKKPKSLANPASPVKLSTNPGSLVLGFPVSQVGQEAIFGGVITKVSNVDNEDLGGLKLSDIPPLHVTTQLVQDKQGNKGLALMGCVQGCTKQTAPEMLIAFPIVSMSDDQSTVYVDLAAVGQGLDVIGLMGAAQFFGLEIQSSNTVTFDFSNGTLVFDVESQYKVVPKQPSANVDVLGVAVLAPPDTQSVITTRYYLKPQPAYNDKFVSREPTADVGFFTTDRSATTYITRWQEDSSKMVHYYIKNVPAEYKSFFSNAFDAWNETFTKILGHNQLEYEFVDQGDPKADLLVTGDIRYNIIEWDLVNKAGYGGLGPSIANQNTGETLAANILIQGPTIVQLYKAWFHLQTQVDQLNAKGQLSAAQKLIKKFHKLFAAKAKVPKTKHSVALGKLNFNIPAENPAYQDTAHQLDFDSTPAGYTYDQYMKGYFLDMVAHEMGHNMGLRHNFRGNLASDDSMKLGTVSRSVMEYLGRGFRYLDQIGEYDRMAISYGYTGKQPTHSDWFCTDEDAGGPDQPTLSAECSKSDATSDPFSFFEGRLAKMADLLVDSTSAEAPVWTLPDLASVFAPTVDGVALYASSAQATANKWTNFFGKQGRPSSPADVKGYVTDAVTSAVCDPVLEEVVQNKNSAQAKQLASDNLAALRLAVAQELVKFNASEGIFTPKSVSCLPAVAAPQAPVTQSIAAH